MIRVRKTSGRPWQASLVAALLVLGPTAQAQTTITNGLVAYWNFDGNFYDWIKDFHGTGRGTLPIPYVDGKPGFGKAIKLNGDNQFVEITGGNENDLEFPGGNMSIAGWFKVDTFDTSWQCLISKGEGSNYRVARRGAESGIAYAGGTTDTPSGTPVDDGTWHQFVAVTEQNVGARLYIDGALDGQFDAAPALASSAFPLMIGENPGARNREWEGELDDIGIWNRVLTETEIATLYGKGAGKPVSSLLPARSGGKVTVDKQPANASTMAGSSVVFSVVASTTGTFPIAYQWRKNGIDLAGANGSSYTNSAPTLAESGAKYSVKVSVPGAEAVSADAILTVAVDIEPPKIASVNSDVSFAVVIVTYSEPVATSAENKANYALDKGVTVNSVSRIDASNIKLTTSKMAEGTDYTLTVNAVQDRASTPNTIVANSKLTFKSWVFATGVVMHKFWENNTANNIAGLTNRTDFPDSPTFVTMEPMWEYGPAGNNESGSNYGNQLIGWFTPARSGNYVFFTNSDDPSSLFLSTDDNPANKFLIASETGWSNARNWVAVGSGDATSKRSDQFGGTEWPNGNSITLQAGKRYYMESLHTEGGGGDSVAATFIIEGDADPVNGDAPKLAGSLIGTYMDPNGASVTISQQPKSATTVANATVTFTVAATGTSKYGTNLTYQWQKAAPGSATFAALAGATATSYTTPFLAAANNGEKYRVVISRPPISETSAEALLTITADTVPPTIFSIAGNPTQVELTVHFSEPLDNASAAAVANYAFDKGLTISSAVLKNQKDVVLTTSKQTAGTSYGLTVSNVKDLAGNAVAANTKLTFNPATVATGAVAYWNFDGDLKDWIKDFHGTARGSPAIPFVDGKTGFGKAIKLDGGTQYVEITGGNENELEFPGGSMSIAGWFKVATFDTSWQALISKGEGTTWRVARRGTGDNIAYAGGVGEGVDDVPPVNDGLWHHFVAVSDAAAVEFGTALYVDGVRYGVQTAAPVISANNLNVRIGENPGATSREWAGELDDIAIWNRVVVPSEVTQLYASGAGKPLGTFLPPPAGEPVTVKVSRSGGALTIQWSPAGGTLEVSPALGPTANWTAVGAANPASITIGSVNAYYRVRK